ncbi:MULTISPECIES: c-type cytochrome [Sulfurimonas]|uniref:C-type cytochrome n=1 Tax=Sulfurimonas diazotrophicus TaxID=3131939 RepID=A0ABZ3HDU1_9BACT
MIRTLAFSAALLLLAGCNDSRKTSPEAAPKAAAPVETPEPAVEPAPTPVKEAADNSSVAAPVSAAEKAPVAQSASVAEASPAVLFQKCAACHGNQGEKMALNQSAAIGEWESKRIADAIIGYQKGTYGGAMKTLMQNQVKDLTPVQVEALSDYIANLYVKTH